MEPIAHCRDMLVVRGEPVAVGIVKSVQWYNNGSAGSNGNSDMYGSVTTGSSNIGQ